MEILKKGSTGDNVKLLQKYLNLTQDGIFGSKTEAAVKQFQSSKGLTADGVVGPKTWSLLISKINKSVDSSIQYNPLNVHITKLSNRSIKYLAIHFTAGSNSKSGCANAVKRVFEQRKASADFCVDDSNMVQINPDLSNYYCWAVGDKSTKSEGGSTYAGKATNRNTISIEICSSLKKGYKASYSNHEGWYYTEACLNNAIKLAKILMKKYNIPIENVIRHYDISGKLCPGIVGWNDGYIYSNEGKRTGQKNNSSEWLKFKEKLKNSGI